MRTKGLLLQYLKYARSASQGSVDPADLLPISPELIAEKVLGVSLSKQEHRRDYRSASGIAGFYDQSSDSITTGSLQTEEQRFTLAHELGHRELGHIRERSLRDRGSNRQVRDATDEVEANFYAANLLMPEKLVVAKFQDRFLHSFEVSKIDDDAAFDLTGGGLRASEIRRKSLVEIAELFARAIWFGDRQFQSLKGVFGVSAEAMARRLIFLKLVC